MYYIYTYVLYIYIYIYIYIYVCVCVCVCVYIYIDIMFIQLFNHILNRSLVVCSSIPVGDVIQPLRKKLIPK